MDIQSIIDDFKTLAQCPVSDFYSLSERESSIEAFSKQGFPSIRDEEWKYTNLRSVLKGQFEFAHTVQAPADSVVAPEGTSPFRVIDIKELLTNKNIAEPEAGVLLGEYNVFPDDLKIKFKKKFAQQDAFKQSAFSLINHALVTDVLCVYISEKIDATSPILLNWQDIAEEAQHLNLQVLVLSEPETHLHIMHCFEETQHSLINLVNKVHLSDKACLTVTKILAEEDKSFHFSDEQIQQGASSDYRSFRLIQGGQLVRDDIQTLLQGEDASVDLSGLVKIANKQHADSHTTVVHQAPHCQSNEFYKAILDNKSRFVFNGKVVVEKDASKTISSQTNNNLLLSSDAEIDTKPELEIYNEDVSCTHGATVGQIEAEQLFYLQSRGIDETQAKQLLLSAFAVEVIQRIPHKLIRSYCLSYLNKHLCIDN